jgi:L-amino acid N-acyltransferase YncA
LKLESLFNPERAFCLLPIANCLLFLLSRHLFSTQLQWRRTLQQHIFIQLLSALIFIFPEKLIMQFRNATIKDLPAIVDIYNSTIADRMVTADTEIVAAIEKEVWFHEHNEETRPLWVIEDDAKNMIGWASFQNFYGRPAYNGTAEISIYLAEEFRGMGYGKKILQYCIDKAPSLQLHTLLGYIFAHNAPSIKLFTNTDFTEWAHLDNIAEMDGKFYSLKIFGRKV